MNHLSGIAMRTHLNGLMDTNVNARMETVLQLELRDSLLAVMATVTGLINVYKAWMSRTLPWRDNPQVAKWILRHVMSYLMVPIPVERLWRLVFSSRQGSLVLNRLEWPTGSDMLEPTSDVSSMVRRWQTFLEDVDRLNWIPWGQTEPNWAPQVTLFTGTRSGMHLLDGRFCSYLTNEDVDYSHMLRNPREHALGPYIQNFLTVCHWVWITTGFDLRNAAPLRTDPMHWEFDRNVTLVPRSQEARLQAARQRFDQVLAQTAAYKANCDLRVRDARRALRNLLSDPCIQTLVRLSDAS